LARDFDRIDGYKTKCFNGGDSNKLNEMAGPGNNFLTRSFVGSASKIEEGEVRIAKIKAAAEKAEFGGFKVMRKNLKTASDGFDCKDCLEGSLPALALFLHRDPYAFASMGLNSNHRRVDPKNFEQRKDDKPSIVNAIKLTGNTSFQTSQVDISFYRIGMRDKKISAEPCLQSVCCFDYTDVHSIGETSKLLFVLDGVCTPTDVQQPYNFFLLRVRSHDRGLPWGLAR